MVILPSSINLPLRCVQPCVCALLYIIIVGLSLSNHHYEPLCGKKKKMFQIKRLLCCCLSVHFKGCASTDFHIFICNLFLMSNTYLNHSFIFPPFLNCYIVAKCWRKEVWAVFYSFDQPINGVQTSTAKETNQAQNWTHWQLQGTILTILV